MPNYQEKIKIPTADGKVIYGLYDTVKKSDVLIIFVHGFTGSSTEHQFVRAAEFFTAHGYHTYRINLYGQQKDARKTPTVTWQNHIDDLEQVVRYFVASYPKIYLVGHSLGGSLVCMVDHHIVKKISLRDPTTGFEDVQSKNIFYEPALDAYLCGYRVMSVFSRALIESRKHLTIPQQLDAIARPAKIFFAGNYTKYDQRKPYLDENNPYCSYQRIVGATHGFIEPGVAQDLFTQTLHRFNKE